jgi:predicted PurR-regulated permease PerM
VVALAALSALFLLDAFGAATHALLVIFAGIVGGSVFHGGAAWLERRTRLGRKQAFAVLVLSVLGPPLVLVVVAGSMIAQNLSSVATEVGGVLAELEDRLDGSSLAPFRELLQRFDELPFEAWFGRVTGSMSWTAGFVVDGLIVLVLALFFALDARVLVDGVAGLAHGRRAGEVRALLGDLGHALRWWFVGRLISMAIVAVATIVGLLLMDVRLAVGLGLAAGLLSFVPNIGPVLSFVPAAAVVWIDDGGRAVLWVFLLYVGIQLVESNALTPLVQKRMVSLPPAMLLSSQVLCGALWGPFGLLIAAPLAVVFLVLARRTREERGDAEPEGASSSG